MKCILRWPISYVLNINMNVYGYFMHNLPISHFILIIHYDFIKCLKKITFFLSYYYWTLSVSDSTSNWHRSICTQNRYPRFYNGFIIYGRLQKSTLVIVGRTCWCLFVRCVVLLFVSNLIWKPTFPFFIK